MIRMVGRLAIIILPALMLTLALTSHAPARADSPAPTQSCGTVNLSTTSNSDATKDFGCFTSAFQSCNAATLTASGRNGDEADTWTFSTVKGGNGCTISETVDRTIAGQKTTDAYVCNSLSNESDGLHFNQCTTKGDVAMQRGDSFSSVLQPLSQQPDPPKT